MSPDIRLFFIDSNQRLIENSLLHFGKFIEFNTFMSFSVILVVNWLITGISVRGSRILHQKRSIQTNSKVQDMTEDQVAGDLYLSSSSLVVHAPEYPNVTWEHRIIAIQV